MMKTSLYQEHLKLGAKMVSFAGWEMPLQYSSILQEVGEVRNRVGLFDVSHMGQIFVSGPRTIPFLDYLSTNPIFGKPFGKAVYTVFCNEEGGAIDDLLVYPIDESSAFVVVNASNREKVLSHMKGNAPRYLVKIRDRFATDGILSCQGPKSGEIIGTLFAAEMPLEHMHFVSMGNLVLSRTGYTGEEGYEIFGPNEEIAKWWKEILKMGVEPCGLGARDILRLEMGYALYGHELSNTIPPLESVAAWAVKFGNRDFVGKRALEKYEYDPHLRHQVGLVGQGMIPAREGYPVVGKKREQIGVITSGAFSPTLEKPIAIALLNKKVQVNENVDVLIREGYYPFQIVKLPFINANFGL